MKMTRRIIHYVVFVTMLWGVFAENQEKLRNLFNNNITRADFGNLLQSLIKLNEQRVNVLKKLYKLEDYGVLSEVLRSGDPKAANGNKNNLLLVVLSKNQSATARRNMDAHIVESIPSLDIKSNPVTINTNPVIRSKSNNYQEIQKHSQKPTSVVSNDPLPNTRQKKLELYLGDGVPKQNKPRNRFEIDDGRHKQTTSANNRVKVDNDNTKYPKVGNVKMDMDNKIYPISDQSKVEDESTEIALDNVKVDRGAENNNEKDSNSLETDDGSGRNINLGLHRLELDNHSKKYPNTPHHNSKYSKKENGNLNDQSNKYPIKDYDGQNDPRNRYPKKDDVDLNDQRNRYPKKDDDNLNDQRNRYPKKDDDNLNDQSNKYTKKDYDDQNDQSNRYTKKDYDGQNAQRNKFLKKDKNDQSNRYPNKDNDNLDEHIKYPDSTKDMNKVDDNSNEYPSTPKVTHNPNRYSSKNLQIQNDDLHNQRNKKPELDVYDDNGDDDGDNNHKIPNMLKAKHETEDYPKLSIETYGETKKNTNLGKDLESKEPGYNEYKPNFNGFEDNEAGPESRKNLQKCIGKRALKLCSKSCITAYKNVCRRLKCTSRSKRSLKKECKKSCTKSFSASKYSSEDY